MGTLKNLDKSVYPSITDAIYEFMDEHLLVAGDAPIYHAKALMDVCFFLAENDIQHEYTIIPSLSSESDQIISLVWMEPGAVGNEVWYSRGEAFPKAHYRVSMMIAANDIEEVESWIANTTEVDVCDWSVDEV